MVYDPMRATLTSDLHHGSHFRRHRGNRRRAERTRRVLQRACIARSTEAQAKHNAPEVRENRPLGVALIKPCCGTRVAAKQRTTRG